MRIVNDRSLAFPKRRPCERSIHSTSSGRIQIKDPAIKLLSRIVHGADVSTDLYGEPEAPGLKAIAEGFGRLGLENDHTVLEKQLIVYDALYEYCRQKLVPVE